VVYGTFRKQSFAGENIDSDVPEDDTNRSPSDQTQNLNSSALPEAPGRIDLSNITQKTQQLGWSVSDLSNPAFTETSESPGPRRIPEDAKSPIDFWKLLISDDMLGKICAYTNDYAEEWKYAADEDIYDNENPSRNKFKPKPAWLLEKWTEVTVSELLLMDLK
jgi:hypothetical protein